VVKPTEIFMKALWPFIRLLNGTGRAVVNMLGLRSRGGHAMVHSEEELKMLVTASQEAGVLEEAEEQMLHRVFAFADLTAGQVMVPRTELVAVEADTPDDVALQQITKSEAHRLLVFRTNLDNVMGILYVKDVLRALVAGNPINPGTLAREALTVPETLTADDVLTAMRRKGVQEAVVIDEYGGTAGVVTFDSLMERIVGDAGAGTGRIRVRPDGSADIDGLTLVTDVNEQFDLDIDSEVFTTVGGYVLGRLGRRARVGDLIDLDRRRMRVDAVDGLRVAKVWLSTPKYKGPERTEADVR
jgi:CBS domain containing-hemolysin-like protein